MFELRPGGQQVDGEDVKAHGNAVAVAGGELGEKGEGEATQLTLLGSIDLSLSGEEVPGGPGFDLDEDHGVAVPGDEVEITADGGGDPAAGHDFVAEATKVEEGVVFATLAEEEVFGFGPLAEPTGAGGFAAVGEGAEAQIEGALQPSGPCSLDASCGGACRLVHGGSVTEREGGVEFHLRGQTRVTAGGVWVSKATAGRLQRTAE